MSKRNVELLAFNRGIVSPRLMAHVDVPRVALSAERQANFIPSSLGPMSLRPGLEFIGVVKDSLSTHIPFIYSSNDTAILEITNLNVRIRQGAILARPLVTSAITNPNFDTDLSGWTDLDTTNAALTASGFGSAWAPGGYMAFMSTIGSAAIREQLVVNNDPGVEHGLHVRIERGPVLLRVGSASGLEDIVAEIRLAQGSHSIAFTPTASFYVRLYSTTEYQVLVDSCAIEPVGDVLLDSLWAKSDLPLIRYAQSADVVFVACRGYPMQRIMRTSARSWSIVDHEANNGPFRAENTTTNTINVTTDDQGGLTRLFALRPLFQASHVGTLFHIKAMGQRTLVYADAANVATNSIKVEGSGLERVLDVRFILSGVITASLERSLDGVGAWEIVATYAATTTAPFDDLLVNKTMYYRLHVANAGYVSGFATMAIGSQFGQGVATFRITDVQNNQFAHGVEVQRGLRIGTTSVTTAAWSEGAWSSFRGFPACVALRDSRLWSAGNDRVWASVTDDYNNHDPEYIGDAGPINRSVGDGAIADMRWMVPIGGKLVIGADAAEFIVKSSSLGEPVTPFNFSLRADTTLGSYDVDAEVLDATVLFVDRSGSRLMELSADGGTDLSVLVPELLRPYITDLAVQRRPDSRIHCVRVDGKVAVLVSSKTEDVRSWITIETDGDILEAFVLPGLEDDDVYYVVRRTVNGSDVYYLERMAKSSECNGGLVNKQADSFLFYNGAPTATITVPHLINGSVVVWGDGVAMGTFATDVLGVVTLPTAVSQAVIGLVYTAQFKSTKLASSGVALISRKRVSNIGVLLADTHAQGLQYGPDFSTLDDLPLIEAGDVVPPNGIWADYNYDHIEFNGTYTVDSRLCLQARAPRPCTVLAVIIEMDV